MHIHRHSPCFTTFLLLFLSGCAAVGMEDGDRRIVGKVDQIQQVPRVNEPPEALQYFGLVGHVMYHSAERLKPTNLYVIKTASDELVMAQVDEEFTIGECVEVIPRKSETATNTFSYGRARIIASAKC